MKYKLVFAILIITLIFSSVFGNAIYVETDNKQMYQNEVSHSIVKKSNFGTVTETFYSTSSDGFEFWFGTDYYQVWKSQVGLIFNENVSITIGQKKWQYWIWRGFVFFNTISIPDNADIISATLSIYGKADWSEDNDFDITIQNGQPTYPHDPLTAVDYNKDHYSGNGGSINTGGFTISGYNHINLNSNGIDWINKQGTTKLCLRSSRDINYNEPQGVSAKEWIVIYSNEKGGNYRPKLTVQYTNNPPESPNKPSGSTRGLTGVEYTYTTSTTDPEGDQVYYKWDWGDGTYSNWLGPYGSGDTCSASHIWNYENTYSVRVKAKDIHDAESDWSAALQVKIGNDPPLHPSTPSGPISGYHGFEYTYSTSTTDPDGDQIKYYFDWGDGTGDWTGWYNSGETGSKSQIWSAPGSYEVKAKAKDIFEAESGWSPPPNLVVTMTNLAPEIPSDPNPPNHDDWVDINADLSWTCNDPNGDNLHYTVYFGTTNPPPVVATNHPTNTYEPGTMEILTTYYWKIEAHDPWDASSNGPPWDFTTREYNPPVLTKYDQWSEGVVPKSGTQSTEFTFAVHYEDPDGDPPGEKNLWVKHENDGNWHSYEMSGSGSDADYTLKLLGNVFGGGEHEYYFLFKDVTGYEARLPENPGENWNFIVNHPPNKPLISGPTQGIPGVSYEYSAWTEDPNDEKIQYWFDWGDGTNSGWTPLEPVSSGTTIKRNHTWNELGKYSIKVKARDVHDDESLWSNPLSVTIPKNKQSTRSSFFSYIERFICRFPLMNQLIFLAFFAKTLTPMKESDSNSINPSIITEYISIYDNFFMAR